MPKKPPAKPVEFISVIDDEDDKFEPEDSTEYDDEDDICRIVRITKEIRPGDFTAFDKRLTTLEAQGPEPIIVRICSGGGDVLEGLAIAGRIRSSTCQVITEGYGIVASMATAVLAAGHKRKISSLCYLMVHECAAGIIGRLHEMREEMTAIAWKERAFSEMMATLSKQPAKYWLKLGTSTKDHWFCAKEVVEKLGIADEII